jgi:hypothetical protein
MYKKIIFIAVLFFAINISAQKHEIKFDIFDLIAFTSLDVSYSYILNEEAAVGVSVYSNLTNSDNIFGEQEEFTITPYYRQYFPLGGFKNMFVEGFFAINSGKNFITLEDQTKKEVDYTDGAFGLVLGRSYITPRGFVFEFYGGLGRNLFDSEGSPTLVPRLGINTGNRF